MIGVDDGIWAGNLDAADVLFLIAAVVFGLAAILPFFGRRTGDGTSAVAYDFRVSLIPAGLCLVALAWLIL